MGYGPPYREIHEVFLLFERLVANINQGKGVLYSHVKGCSVILKTIIQFYSEYWLNRIS